MELTELRYFFHVATTRSFSRGAKLSHVSAPAISKAVKRLEEELGTTLLRRSTRNVSVTPSGELVLSFCRRILGDADALKLGVDELRGAVRGTLRVAAMEVFNAHALPVCMATLVRNHPQVEPRAFRLAPTDIVGGLLQGTLDVGFVIGAVDDPRIRNEVLVTCPGSVVCGVGHALYADGTIGEVDLEAHPFVVQQFYQKDYLGPADTFPDDLYSRTIGAHVETLKMGIKMVEAGTLLGYFPDVAIRCQLNHGELKRLDGLQPGEPFELCAVTAAGAVERPAARVLIDAMAAELEELLVADCAV
jgi:LysR family transcriptional regulator, cyn operon transcriptional activator